MQQPQPQGQQQPGPGQQLGGQGAAPGAGGGPGGGPGPGPCLRRELKLLESIFHRGHERFRIASACLDELSCEFLLAGAGGAGAGAAPGPHLPPRGSVPGDPVRIHCNITVRTSPRAPARPPVRVRPTPARLSALRGPGRPSAPRRGPAPAPRVTLAAGGCAPGVRRAPRHMAPRLALSTGPPPAGRDLAPRGFTWPPPEAFPSPAVTSGFQACALSSAAGTYLARDSTSP